MTTQEQLSDLHRTLEILSDAVLELAETKMDKPEMPKQRTSFEATRRHIEEANAVLARMRVR